MPIQIPSSSDEGLLECMETRRPRQRTLPRKGPQSREVSFQVRYPNPCKNPSGIFQDRYLHERSRKKGPSGPFLKDRPPVMSEWPPSGAPSLGPIPGTESPRNRERDPNLGLVGSVCLSSGPGSPGKPPAASYEVCRCCKARARRPTSNHFHSHRDHRGEEQVSGRLQQAKLHPSLAADRANCDVVRHGIAPRRAPRAAPPPR
jgi:hypothetical protein